MQTSPVIPAAPLALTPHADAGAGRRYRLKMRTARRGGRGRIRWWWKNDDASRWPKVIQKLRVYNGTTTWLAWPDSKGEKRMHASMFQARLAGGGAFAVDSGKWGSRSPEHCASPSHAANPKRAFLLCGPVTLALSYARTHTHTLSRPLSRPLSHPLSHLLSLYLRVRPVAYSGARIPQECIPWPAFTSAIRLTLQRCVQSHKPRIVAFVALPVFVTATKQKGRIALTRLASLRTAHVAVEANVRSCGSDDHNGPLRSTRWCDILRCLPMSTHVENAPFHPHGPDSALVTLSVGVYAPRPDEARPRATELRS